MADLDIAALRTRLAGFIEQEYDLADPMQEGYRPAASTLAGLIIDEILRPALIAALETKTGECDALAAKVAKVRALIHAELLDYWEHPTGAAIVTIAALEEALGEQP